MCTKRVREINLIENGYEKQNDLVRCAISTGAEISIAIRADDPLKNILSNYKVKKK